MGNRLKGQDTFLDLIIDGKPDQNLGPWKSLEISLDQEILEEEYLGETSKQYDEIFNGVEFNLEGAVLSFDYFKFADKCIRRARYQTGGIIQIDMQTTFIFSSGLVLPYKLRDVKMGAFPINVGSRRDFVSVKLTGKCSNQPKLPNI